MTTDNKPISFLHLLSLNTLLYVSIALYAPFLSAYYRQHGLTTTQIGMLSMIACISTIFIQPLWARRADLTGKARTYASIVTAGVAAALMTYYLGTSFQNFLFSASLLAVFSTSVSPMVDAIVIRNARELGYDFSKIRLGGTIGYAIVVYFVGSFLKAHPSAQFTLAAVSYLVFALAIRLLPKSEDEQPIAVTEKKKRFNFNLEENFRTHDVIYVLLFAFVFQLGAGFSGAYLSVYAVDLGYTQSEIGLMQFCSASSEIPILLLAHRLFRRFDSVKLIGIGCLLMGIRIFIVSGGSLAFFICSQLMQGVTYMVIHYGCSTYISAAARVGKASECQSILHIVQTGIASILAYLFGGRLIEWIGFAPSYRLVGCAVLVTSVVLMFIMRGKTEPHTEAI
ncbi:MAG: MFS transporter [Solobacterium sp.]|nr:MFS transporter [Solobacterium sp.]